MGIDEMNMGRLMARCPMCRSVVVESVGFCLFCGLEDVWVADMRAA